MERLDANENRNDAPFLLPLFSFFFFVFYLLVGVLLLFDDDDDENDKNDGSETVVF